MLSRRLQILIDESRYRRLAARAKESNLSVAAVIRDAIDVAVPGDNSRKRSAWKRLAQVEPMSVPASVEELKAELDELRSGGL